MSLQELRFFSIYLAKINARDTSTRVVRFSLSDFQRIMEYQRLNRAQLQQTIDSLLSKVVGVKLENGGFRRFQLFKSGEFSQDETGGWYIEIDAHDESLPLMFEFKERYFTYELWNALRLKGTNQLRMYEILKQYEQVGERVVTLEELKALLGMGPSGYPRYMNFKRRVLESCKEALEEYTDIKFAYEPAEKNGKKIIALKFFITKNEKHFNQLSLDEFIGQQKPIEPTHQEARLPPTGEFENERLDFLADACDREFTEAEVQG
jgi:plasmid replication initiation protein